MNKLSIAHRIMLLIVASVIALLLVGYYGLSVGNKGSDSIKTIQQDSLAGETIAHGRMKRSRVPPCGVRENLLRKGRMSSACQSNGLPVSTFSDPGKML